MEKMAELPPTLENREESASPKERKLLEPLATEETKSARATSSRMGNGKFPFLPSMAKMAELTTSKQKQAELPKTVEKLTAVPTTMNNFKILLDLAGGPMPYLKPEGTNGLVVKSKTGAVYEEVSSLGEGAYGKVYKARNIKFPEANEFVALKRIRIKVEAGLDAWTMREMSIAKLLTQFYHPNLLRLYEICCGPIRPNHKHLDIYLVMECMDQDLYTYMMNVPEGCYTRRNVMYFAFNILNGIEFLHRNKIVHRDLKPQNILVSNSGQVKITDFGLSKIYEVAMPPPTTVVVTLWYRAPEILLGSSYSFPVDIWAFGTILAELWTRRPLFPGSCELDQLKRIFAIMGTPPVYDWPDGSPVLQAQFEAIPCLLSFTMVLQDICPLLDDLLLRLLTFNPYQRLNAVQALNHPFFVGFAA